MNIDSNQALLTILLDAPTHQARHIIYLYVALPKVEMTDEDPVAVYAKTGGYPIILSL